MYQSRYRRIISFFARIIALIIFWDIFLPRIGLRRWSSPNRTSRYQKYAAQYRMLAIQMGGVLIKVGQFLSTRVDVLPKSVTDELAGLQDEVPEVPYPLILQAIQTEFGRPLEQVFSFFEPSPLAAASLGQVHKATLVAASPLQPSTISGNGHPPKAALTDVVVKVQRPDIEKLIAVDLKALYTVGNWLKRYKPIRRRANIPALLDEFSKILYAEIDYLAEGKNAETFAANFANIPGVRVPKVFWTHTTVRVLTLENVFAIKITDYQEITNAKINRAEVAERLLDTYLQQIFEDGFFHSDPHPGNLFVEPAPQPVLVAAGQGSANPGSPQSPNNNAPTWQLTFVDFGMVGHVPSNLRAGLRELLIGVGTRDSQRVVKAYQAMGILLPNADLQMLERAEERIFERYWGMNMTELSNLNVQDFREFTSEFRELIYDLPFQIPQDLIFLVRCVGILSGMCTGLDPQFNFFAHLVPYTKKLIANEARDNRRDWITELETITRSWLSTPAMLQALITKIERGEITVRDPNASQQTARLDTTVRVLAAGIIFAGLLIGGIQLFLGGYETLAAISAGAALIILLWIIYKYMITSL